jgi:lysophospholipase L1-like esterase
LGASLASQELAPLPVGARPESNFIQRPLELSFFFRNLRNLESHQGPIPRRLSILEIGDSHLQGDLFSRPLRLALGRRFGLAGRGLIFPYEVAGTTNAFDIASQSNVRWIPRRAAVAPLPGFGGLDTGAAGFAILTHDPGYVLHMALEGDEERFDTVSVFSRRDAQAFGLKISVHSDAQILAHENLVPHPRLHPVQPGDSLYKLSRLYKVSIADIKRWNRMQGDQIFAGEALIVGQDAEPTHAVPDEGFRDLASIRGDWAGPVSLTANLQEPASDFFIRGFQDGKGESEAVIYGAEVERRGVDGIIYHTAGVNGAQLKHFANNPRFIQEARCLDPDLVIVALGTNESMGRSLKPREIEDGLNNLMLGLTHKNPKYVAFLLITPPDVVDWSGNYNPLAQVTAQHLRDFARRHALALWDWQAVMGGPGSVFKWRDAHLVLSDGVHMTHAGYQLQSALFFRAFMDAYERR